MKGRPWGSTIGAPAKSQAHFSIDKTLKEWACETDMPMSRFLELALHSAKARLTSLLGDDLRFAVLRPLSLVEYGTVNLAYDGYYAFAEHAHCTFAAPYSTQAESDFVLFGRVQSRRVVDIEYSKAIPKGSPEDAVPDSRKKMIKLYASGLSYSQIAIRLGLGQGFVNSTFCELRKQFFLNSSYEVCKLFGYECEKVRQTLRITETEENRILKMHHEGCKREFICKQLNITHSQYSAAKARIFRRYNVTSLKKAWAKISAA